MAGYWSDAPLERADKSSGGGAGEPYVRAGLDVAVSYLRSKMAGTTDPAAREALAAQLAVAEREAAAARASTARVFTTGEKVAIGAATVVGVGVVGQALGWWGKGRRRR
jgi:hypothetical protein